MFRPIQIVTATILACLMLVVTTTSHLGMSFCLCQNMVLLGDDICSAEELNNTSFGESSTSCCSSQSCSSQINHHKLTAVNTHPQIEIQPCTNCHIELNWKLDNCIPFSLTGCKSPSQLELADDTPRYKSKTSLDHPALQIITTRGSPLNRDLVLASSVPLYKRHSVYLI